jgi:8-hydroxy-5-deazaflavin:NADPH oxidoreductase
MNGVGVHAWNSFEDTESDEAAEQVTERDPGHAAGDGGTECRRAVETAAPDEHAGHGEQQFVRNRQTEDAEHLGEEKHRGAVAHEQIEQMALHNRYNGRMKIGILGSGDVGKALGAGFAALGHDVMIGTRDPGAEKVRAWTAKIGAHASAGTFAQAATFAEVAVLATLWDGTENAIRLAGPQNLAGKIVIDTTNPLDFSSGPPPKLSVGHTDSAGERVQRWLPAARVVKAFNIVGNPHMFRPTFPGGPPDMFICGNDASAKNAVAEICTAFGWPQPIDLGGIESARYLEPLAMVWILVYFATRSGNHAFKLLRK